ncbi:hypothetical protein D3C79_730410 [compost metagenome]
MGEQQHCDVDQQVDQADTVAHWVALSIRADEVGQGNTHLHQPGGLGQGAACQWQERVEQQPAQCLPARPARRRSAAGLCLEVLDGLLDTRLVERCTDVRYGGFERKPGWSRCTERHAEIILDGVIQVRLHKPAVSINAAGCFGQPLEQIVLQLSRETDGNEQGQAVRELQQGLWMQGAIEHTRVFSRIFALDHPGVVQ